MNLRPAGLEKFIDRFLVHINALLVIALGLFDYATGYELSFSIFYLLPILWVSWRRGRRFGLELAVLSTTIWFSADLAAGRTYSHFLIPVWNMFTRLLLFFSIVIFADGFKKELELEQELSRKDSLTKLANTRFFMERAVTEIDKAAQFQQPVSLAYIDIDNFKQANDQFGHRDGDVLLFQVAEMFRGNLREYDVVGRIGGDEFVILLPGANRNQAEIVMEKLQSILFSGLEPRFGFISFSVGVVTYYQYRHSLDEMIKKADNLMYQAKKNGKNKIEYEVVGDDAAISSIPNL